MDRPRTNHTGRTGIRGAILTRLLSAAALAGATIRCGFLNPDFDRIVAIQVETQNPTVQVGDSLRLVAHAVSAAGDVVEDAAIFWAIIDTGQVGFTLDTATGVVTGVQVDSGRVQARVEAIRSDPVTVIVVAAENVMGLLSPPPRAWPRRRRPAARRRGRGIH